MMPTLCIFLTHTISNHTIRTRLVHTHNPPPCMTSPPLNPYCVIRSIHPNQNTTHQPSPTHQLVTRLDQSPDQKPTMTPFHIQVLAPRHALMNGLPISDTPEVPPRNTPRRNATWRWESRDGTLDPEWGKFLWLLLLEKGSRDSLCRVV